MQPHSNLTECVAGNQQRIPFSFPVSNLLRKRTDLCA